MCVDSIESSVISIFKLVLFMTLTCFVMVGCAAWNRGLEPIYPSYGLTWESNVNTLTPTLKWKPYDDVAGKEDIRYQLEVMLEKTIILSKDDIREAYYTVNTPFERSKVYQWHVRPVWTVDGKTMLGQWNYKSYFFVTPILFGWGTRNYNFTTPEK